MKPPALSASSTASPSKQLAAFIAKFDPKVAELIRACRTEVRKLLPTAIELVYDNYNFFVIGYASTERASDAILSIAAASNGVTSLFNIGGFNPRTEKLYNYIETYAGGQGAMHNQDGMDAVQCHMTNTRNAPVEVIESTYPLLVRSYGLVPDSDGPGRYRGGLGMRREIEIQSQKTTLTVSTDRSRLKPWGVFGGMAGGNSSCFLEHRDGKVEKLAYSKMTRPVEEGDVVTIMTPGAGGWEDPLTRDPEKVLWDVTEEFVSPERAKEFYGVVVEKKGYRRFEINRSETDRVRHKNTEAQRHKVDLTTRHKGSE